MVFSVYFPLNLFHNAIYCMFQKVRVYVNLANSYMLNETVFVDISEDLLKIFKEKIGIT